MDLTKYEGIIRSIARRYGSNYHDIEDLEQIGRMAVATAFTKRLDLSLPAYRFMETCIENAIKGVIKASRTKKITPPSRIVSLSEPINHKGETLESIVGQEDQITHEECLLETIFEELRRRYGRYYVTGIMNETQPRRIIKRVIRAVIEDIAKIPRERVPNVVNYEFFVSRGLGPILWVFYDNSPFRAVNDAYEGTFLPWEFKRGPQRLWKGRRGYKNAIEAVRWFVNKKGLKEPQDCRSITFEYFKEAGLESMLNQVFNGSPFAALKTYFQDLKPWQASRNPKGTFDEKRQRMEALNSFLINNGCPPLQTLTPEETYECGLRTFVTKEALANYGLRGLLDYYDNGIYRMFCEIFPGKILPWTLTSLKEAWKDEPRKTAAEAVRWLFERYFEIPIEDIPAYATCDLFWRVGFSGILTNRKIGFNSSPYAAVENAYPGLFNPKDFQRHRETIRLEIKELKKPWREKVLKASYP